MKTNIYSKENVLRTLNDIRKYFKVLFNKVYSIEEVINAFNKLTMKYQDLLLKPNKDENDKALLRIPYEELRKVLMENKEELKDVKLKIKSLNKKREEIKYKNKPENERAMELLGKVNMTDMEKLMILYKYGGERILSNSQIADVLNKSEDEINEIVNKFWSLDEISNKKVLKKEVHETE